MGNADKSKLLAAKVGKTVDVQIPDVGTVTVRALSAGEVKRFEGKSETEAQRLFLATAMVDPQLSPDEVDEWVEHAPFGHLVVVLQAIYKLSGITPGAAKKSMDGVRGKRNR